MTKQVGLRTEILVTLTFLLIAALLLGGLLMLRLTEKQLLDERMRHLNEVTKIIALMPAALPSTSLRQTLNLLTETSHCDSWWIYDQHLQLLESYSLVRRDPLNPSRRQQAQLTKEVQQRVTFPALLALFQGSDSGAHFAIPLFDGQRFNGLIELHFSLDDLRQQLLGSLPVLLLYVALYGLVLIAAGYFLLQRNIIRPAQVLLRATRAVGRGSLTTRLPTNGPHEIAQLAAAYNQMVDALRLSRAETDEQIHQLEQANRQLQQARDELVRSEKMASVGQLAAGLAHELGNPLAALIGYLELLKQKKFTCSNSTDIIERSLTETMRIDYLVRELLNFSRPQSVTIAEPVDLAAELRACCQLLKNQGSLGFVQIVDILPDSLQTVMINRKKLEQVLINLLVNAVHACNGKGHIELSGKQDDTNVWIAISDSGCGISEENLNRIFDPFYTTKAPGTGTGLGLTLCHRIIEEAGGRILVTSQAGVGSCFRVKF